MTDEMLGAEALWDLGSGLAGIVGCPVDLLDLRAASTVMQYRIVTTGQRLWARDGQAALYESFILGRKTALDEARAGLLEDIVEPVITRHPGEFTAYSKALLLKDADLEG
ncbi:hypothetical protein LQ562_11840 [Acidovorax sp. D4N7]|nr:hypothetical protein [Acidovorax sp. D4N7]